MKVGGEAAEAEEVEEEASERTRSSESKDAIVSFLLIREKTSEGNERGNSRGALSRTLENDLDWVERKLVRVEKAKGRKERFFRSGK